MSVRRIMEYQSDRELDRRNVRRSLDKRNLEILKKIKSDIYSLTDDIDDRLLAKLGVLKDAIANIIIEQENLIDIPGYKVKESLGDKKISDVSKLVRLAKKKGYSDREVVEMLTEIADEEKAYWEYVKLLDSEE